MYLVANNLRRLGIVHGFCGRLHGLSLPPYNSLNTGLRCGDEEPRVWQNLQLIGRRAGFSLQQLHWARQQSGDGILEVRGQDRAESSRNKAADSLITQATGMVLAVKTADCLPILIGAQGSSWVAVVHMGWRGALLEILPKTLKRLIKARVAVGQLYLALGPAIGPCCLRLDGAAQSSFEKRFANHRAFHHKRGEQALYLDLWELATAAALAAGVNRKNIEILRRCTVCQPRAYFSYRREGARTGRQLSFIIAAGIR